MRILITNDDGMNASQLPKLIAWAKKLGEVTVVVPKVEQSAKSHGIEIHKPFEARQVTLPSGDVVWAVDSTPADCVRFAKFGLKLDFDLVFSGVNRGLNIGTDSLYSGTVSAASEAVLLGMKAVALSTNPANYDKATEELDRVWAYFQENKLLEKNKTVAVFAAAAICPIVNTGVFLLGCLVFFLDTITGWAALYGFENVGAYMIFGLTGANFLIELGVNLVLAPVITRLIKIGKK